MNSQKTPWKTHKVQFMAQSAAIAAIYAVLTVIFFSTSYGPIQVRFSEALTVLPMFTPAAVPGLFVGCVIANLVMGEIYDIIVGSLVTLAAAYISYKLRRKPYLVPLPPVLLNGLIVGPMVHFIYGAPFEGAPLLATMAVVTLGEIIACYGLGYPLMGLFNRYKDKIFKL